MGLWACLLALADKNGCLDVTTDYIAAVTGMAVTDIESCINRFMQPDPKSRTPDREGKRLELIDPERTWGWRIINHAKYREKARKAASDSERAASGRNAERMKLRKARPGDPTRPAPTRADPPSDADSDSDLLKKAANAAEHREVAKRLWPQVRDAIRYNDQRSRFPSDSAVGQAIAEIGGWHNLGMKDSKLIGQTEQAFLNAYAHQVAA
jgi:hypothetical protein